MKSNWLETTLGAIAEQVGGLVDGPFGSNLPASDYVQKGVPVIRGSNLAIGVERFKLDAFAYVPEETLDRLKRSECLPEDIIFTKKGTLGQTGLVPKGRFDHYLLSSNQMRMRVDNSKANPHFVYYYVSSSTSIDKVKRDSEFTGVPKINLGYLKKFPITLPPLNDQNKIVEILDSFENKIELNRQTNQTLEHIAQAIFKSWFVDFEPVKAKIQAKQNGRARQDGERSGSQRKTLNVSSDATWPEAQAGAGAEGDPERAAMCAISGKTDAELDAFLEASTPEQRQQLTATAALFPDELEDSELGPIPKGWDVKPLDVVANYQNGLALQKYRPEDENDYLPVVKIAHLKKGFADGEEKASPNIKPKCIIDDGDVVFSWSGSLMVDLWCGGRAALNQHLFKVTSDQYPKWFYLFWTKHHLARFQQIAADKAVTMGHIKRSHLREALCCIPTNKFLKHGLVGDLVSRQIGARLECVTLEGLRDSLLPKLLSGEITLSGTLSAAASVAC